MKALITTLAVLAVAVTAMTFSSTASAAGYTCKYRSGNVYTVIDGYDNMPAYCRAFSGGFGSARRVSWVPRRVYCAWAYRSQDVRVSIRSTSGSYGRLFCQLMRNRMPAGFYRIR